MNSRIYIYIYVYYSIEYLYMVIISVLYTLLIFIYLTPTYSGAYQPEVDANNVPVHLVWIFNLLFTVCKRQLYNVPLILV